MEYLSVCSGIEAATVAWRPLGWSAVAFAENVKFPSAVLQHHYPETPNHGDINAYERWPDADIDVLVGGTPCQSFSVAGLRKGMADPRGNLSLVYLAIAERCRPDWLVWENVPGVLSSNGGRDFGSIIGGMVELGYGIAYRVLDAQYFGVPQRRRRVFVVGYLGDWRRAAAVLFERESLRRDPAPRRGQRKDIASGVAKSIRGNSGGIDREDMHTLIAPPITSTPYGDHDSRHEHLIPDVANPLTARMHKGINTTLDEGQTPIVAAYGIRSDASRSGEAINPSMDAEGRMRKRDAGFNVNKELCPTIDSAPHTVAFVQNQRDEVRLMDKAGALAAEPGAKQQTYVFKPSHYTRDKDGAPSEVMPPLSADADKGDQEPVICTDFRGHGDGSNAPTLRAKGTDNDFTPMLNDRMAVRRLTPLECERLQGFPDGYTDIPGASDSARYKALGNSMAVPVMRWIGERITDQTEHGQSE